jgi:hypothetical protein
VRGLAYLAALALLAAGCGGRQEAADLPLGRQVSARATLDPPVQLFAEPVLATVEVVADREHVDPALLRVETDFLPFDVQGSEREREDRGRFTVLRYRYLLRCLRIACIPEVLASAAGAAESGRGERRSVTLPAARVLLAGAAGEARVLTRASWPELVSVSRIKESDVPRFGYVFATSLRPLPEPDYRLSPTALAAGLLAGAATLLLLPAGLAVGWLRRRRPPPVVQQAPEPTPLERALLLVEWALERVDGADRRQALELLAVELEALERTDLAASARTLAWSREPPSPESALALARAVGEEVARG